MKQFDIYLVDLDPTKGSEQAGKRPVVIIQEDISNTHSPVTIICAITSSQRKENIFNVYIQKNTSKLPKDSFVLINQIRTIDKSRCLKKIGEIQDTIIQKRIQKGLKAILHIQ